MTLEKANISVESLHEVRDRPLSEAYGVHDVGHDVLVARLEAHGYHVVDHGDDARHADEVFFGDGPDLAVFRHFDEHTQEPVDLLAYIEIKCKESPEWFGRCNRRHYKEYLNHVEETPDEVPTFIWFALVDREEPTVIHREAFVEVTDSEQLGGDVWDVAEHTLVFDIDDTEAIDGGYRSLDGSDVVQVDGDTVITGGIPDVFGNDVVELNDDRFRSWQHFQWRLDDDS